jgi:hypothetical protein
MRLLGEIKTAYNSTYPKGGVSCSKDSFVVNGSFVFQIKFCGKSPALRVAAKRYAKPVGCIGTSNSVSLNEQLTIAQIINQVQQKINTA